MDKKFLIASNAIAILTGLCLGVGITQTMANRGQHGSHGGSEMAHQGHGNDYGHSHKQLEIPAGQPVPEVDLIVTKDSMKGWNLEIKTSNFKLAPENVNQGESFSEGHAHLFINGKKVTRLYGNWYYLDNLQPGTNEIIVTLNANNHDDLVHNGQMISDTEIIEVPTP